MKQQLETTTLS